MGAELFIAGVGEWQERIPRIKPTCQRGRESEPALRHGGPSALEANGAAPRVAPPLTLRRAGDRRGILPAFAKATAGGRLRRDSSAQRGREEKESRLRSE